MPRSFAPLITATAATGGAEEGLRREMDGGDFVPVESEYAVQPLLLQLCPPTTLVVRPYYLSCAPLLLCAPTALVVRLCSC